MKKFSKPNETRIIDENTMVIFIGPRKLECLIDTEDYPRLRMFTWHASSLSKRNKTQYATGSILGPKIMMHRLILSFPLEGQVDHINHNGLDNRKVNLRVVSATENSQNKPIYSNNALGIKGVRERVYKNGTVGYGVRIRVNKELVYIGQFKTKEEAIEARAKAEIDFFIQPILCMEKEPALHLP